MKFMQYVLVTTQDYYAQEVGISPFKFIIDKMVNGKCSNN